ncbi:RNAse (barnase) inhibitor barstar [Pseudoxanthomonas japonensis]|uniref:barstar family protein n=1 Tax=Pseudoxanthomonas japonensis TaxID=69284 RepID=UPI002863062E|nr:barstar family protein [Pseudoxanthomonas japonensis]MDR7069804.1 RNAse (barnase) inhibitor barstar [Pseudoxanthomonas japonensis]
MPHTLTLDGRRIHDIPSFYDEINRVFMAGVDWTLGPSLDALDDLLYGGYGALGGDAPVTLVWTHFAASRDALGVETTRQYLLAKLAHPERINTAHFQHALDALGAGNGQTYCDIVLEIIAAHPNITLVPDEPACTGTP